jgi:adapter protein MecA 1/2
LKMEKINENKIKVTISLDDLEERNIDLDSLNYNSPAAQELFWDMMEQAEVEFGFNISDSQLVIEPTPDIEDGFIIIITKIDEDGDFESIHKYIKNRYKKSDLKSKRKSKKIYSSITIYSFRSFDDLCELSKRIQQIYSGESTLFKYKATYYLLLTRSNFTVSNMELFDIMMSEYSEKVSNASFYEGYLNEYGEIIVSNDAIEIINNYF